MLVTYAVLLPVGLFGLETLALMVWLHYTSEPNKSGKKGKSNGR